MTTITSLGVGSGLDLQGLVDALVQTERAQLEGPLDRREAGFEAELSAYGSLKSSLSTFQGSLSGLMTAADFNKSSLASSNSDVFTASASGNVSPASYDIEVDHLASAHKLATAAFANKTDPVGTGELTFRFGTYDSDADEFTANPDKAIGTVTIDGTNNSLQGIRDAVNAADIGVSASIVNDGSGYRLLFKSDDTGAANSLEITVDDTGDNKDRDNAGLSMLAYDPTRDVGNGKNLTQTSEALDALFSIDGLQMTRAGNSVSGAIEGVTLELKGETSGSPERLSVDHDLAGIKTAVNNFVSGYNTLTGSLEYLAGYNEAEQQGGVLMGDSITRSITNQMRNILTGAVSGLSGQYTALSQLGISTQLDGSLELDTAVLSEALENDYQAVSRVFAATGVASDSLINYVGADDDTQPGDYAVEITQVATQGRYTGGGVADHGIDIKNGDDTFEIKVNGIQSGTIALTKKKYDTSTELAAEMQSRINADSALKDAGISVTVSYVTDHFEVTSSNYGSASKVEFTAVESNKLGLAVGAGVDGLDVTGSIGGVAGIGFGQSLRGVGDAEDLQLEILGGAIGARGSVSFSRGIADQMNSFLDLYLGADSLIDVRTKGIETSMNGIDDQRDQVDVRMAAFQARYVAQFTALDLMLSQLQSTSSYLTQQLQSLPGFTYQNDN